MIYLGVQFNSIQIKILNIHPITPEARKIGQVISTLEKGDIIAYPTDSSPAIGCDPFQKKSVLKLCQMKKIDPNRADLTFLCESISQISTLTKQLDNKIFKALKSYLPGPITFVLPSGRQSKHYFRNKRLTIGVRMPDHQIIQSILAAFGKPLLSTSIAYPSQQDSMQMWQVIPYIPKGVTTVIDDGEDLRPPGTVVSYLTNEFRIIREGDIRFSS